MASRGITFIEHRGGKEAGVENELNLLRAVMLIAWNSGSYRIRMEVRFLSSQLTSDLTPNDIHK